MQLMNDLRQSKNDTIPDYVHRYGTLWMQTHSRFLNSTDALSKVLKPVYEDDTFKTAMFLASLHPSLNDIVDNLNTKSNLTYADATAQLLSMRSSNIDTAKALNAIQKRNKGKSANTSRKPNPPGQGKTAPPNKGECSWCKKNGYNYTGHIHSQCNRLKEHKKKNSSQGEANLAQNVNSSESAEHGIAFMAYTISSSSLPLPSSPSAPRSPSPSASWSASPSAFRSPSPSSDSLSPSSIKFCLPQL
ncbi:hypothetical protein BGX38DRAFT_1316779 [Terfezia claveryi]|nr:hypothetical protein BGX38DRAFT_1316779 [Terfezia claveryi]